ncbi:hypothetical protein D3C80_1091920 [compost metagenome]
MLARILAPVLSALRSDSKSGFDLSLMSSNAFTRASESNKSPSSNSDFIAIAFVAKSRIKIFSFNDFENLRHLSISPENTRSWLPMPGRALASVAFARASSSCFNINSLTTFPSSHFGLYPPLSPCRPSLIGKSPYRSTKTW